MKQIATILILLFCAVGSSQMIVKQRFNSLWSFPDDNLISNPEPDGDTDWYIYPTTSPSMGDNYFIVTAAGAISSSGNNWELTQANVFPLDQERDFTISFKARVDSGSGDFQVGNGYTPRFAQAITSDWEYYSVSFTNTSLTGHWHRLNVGGTTSGDVFHIKEITVVED